MSDYRWLTPLSQHFLDKDYLMEGQTVDDRVDIIAQSAEHILKKPGFANKFKSYFQKGWYSLSTPIWTNFGTARGMPISCVSGDTWINTKTGGGKQAKEIVIGDEVLTHKGRYRRVTDIMLTPARSNIYKLKISTRMTNLYITENHLVLTNLGWVRVDSLHPDRHLVAVNRVLEFVEIPYVIDLRPYVPYEIVEQDQRLYKAGSTTVRADKRVEIVSYYSAPFSNVAVDDNVAWALGLWFAEGSLSRNDRGDPNGIRITVGIDEVRQAQKWLTIMSKAFGVNGNGYESSIVRHGKPNRWYNVNLNSGIIGRFFEQFGDNCKTKTIPDWLIDSPVSTLSAFLDAFLFGDGSIRPFDANRVTVANPRLALQIYQIGLKLGKSMSLQMQEKAGALASTCYVYTVLFRSHVLGTAKATGNVSVPFSDGLNYAAIRTLEKTERVEDVYDFTVEDDHSFSAAGVIVHNCFGSHISDNMESILGAHSEVGMMSKLGGGTSAYFGDLRCRGAAITGNGESSGSVHFMQLFDSIINIVSQGKTRRGNFAAYLPIDHPDIMEFLTIRSEGSPLQDISFGVTVPDAWMEAMIAGDIDKRRIWAKVLECRANVGYPYIVFIDTANRNTVDVYKDKGMKITHSNLCVTGDQLVVTSNGMKRVVDLYRSGEPLTLFDGEKEVSSSPMKLIERNAPIYEIKTTTGRTHRVTCYHKVKTDKGMVAATDLAVGDRVCIQRTKGLFGDVNDPQKAFLLGLYQADGTQTSKTVFIDLWEKDFDLIQEIEDAMALIYANSGWLSYAITVPGRGEHTRASRLPRFFHQSDTQGGCQTQRIQSSKLKQAGFVKGEIPQWIWDSDETTQGQYLRGLYFADGTVTVGTSAGNPLQLSLASIDRNFLGAVQILLSNHGINSAIYLLREAGETMLPDGKGGQKLYACKDCYRLCVSNKRDAIKFEALTGFLSRKGINIEDREYRDNTKKFDTVESVKFLGAEDVYCTTVATAEHVWVCNSFITSNCSEIMLPDNEEESFVCDLSSMNMLHYDEWKNTDAVEIIVYLLDAVMTEFIQKAKPIPFMGRAVRFAERHRALGLGWLGWHSLLQSKMIPFESMDAKMLNAEIAVTVKKQAYAASAKLATEYGEPEVLKGYGRRNTTLMAIAPTKSSAFILGQVSEGVEPHRSNYYIKDLAKGKYTVKNPHLETLLAEKGMDDDDDTWDSILKHGGSVQHLSCLNEHEKSVFKTFAEITPKEIIIQASQRQKHIDQSQSLNLMIHPSIPIKDVNSLLIEAWRLGIKSLYYQISVNAAQSFSRSILACASCEA